MSGYEGEGTSLSGGFGDSGGKPGEDRMADALAMGSGTNRALSNAERQGMGWGSVEGFNLNNPTQSVDEMANAERVSGALSAMTGFHTGQSLGTGFNGLLGSPFGQIARSLLSMNPMGAMFNTALSAYQQRDNPVAALLGMVPGMPGMVGRAAYSAFQSPDPLASLGRSALTAGAGILGGQFGGPLGARAGANLAGYAMGPAGAPRGNPSPAGGSQQFAAQDLSAPPGGGSDWARTLQRNFGGPG